MFDNEKIMDAAKMLGLEIKFNSENPGFHFKDLENKTVNYFDFDTIAAAISNRLHQSSTYETISFVDEIKRKSTRFKRKSTWF